MTRHLHPFGLHFAIGLQPSATLTEHDRTLLEKLNPAGIILFRDSFAHGEPYDVWLEKLRTLLNDARDCIGRERIMIAIDHEGGRVIRTPPPITHYAYAREWTDSAASVAEAMAIELRSIGMNTTFGPVVDIHSNPANPVIGARAFATTPEEVTAAALRFIQAVESNGITSCPKHFPGHGDTAVDSHHGMPVVDYDLDALRQRELLPFKATIDAGVRMVMTAHILFPKIDPDVPSTMSRRIVKGILRDELGFDGVVVTDDIGMGAVREMFNQPEASHRMMNATTDLIDICSYGTDTMHALQIARDIEDGLKSGKLNAPEMDASAQRIQRLLDTLPQHEVQKLDDAVFADHAQRAALHDAAVQGAATWQRQAN